VIRDKSQNTKSKSEMQLQVLPGIISLRGKTGFIQKKEVKQAANYIEPLIEIIMCGDVSLMQINSKPTLSY